MEYGNQTAGFAVKTGSYSLTATEVGPSPENSRVRDGISTAEQALSALHEVISHLEKRLDTVLRPVPPQSGSVANSAQVASVGSHVTGRLSILNEGFGHAIQRLNELGGRIEV